MKTLARPALRSAATSISTMAGVRIRALTERHPIKPTSPRCHSAWQLNLGRHSTYRRGKSVQTTGTTSNLLRVVAREVGDVQVSRLWIQQTVRDVDRAERGPAAVEAQVGGGVHRLYGVRRHVFHHEVSFVRKAAAVPGPHQVAQVAQVDVVVADHHPGDSLPTVASSRLSRRCAEIARRPTARCALASPGAPRRPACARRLPAPTTQRSLVGPRSETNW